MSASNQNKNKAYLSFHQFYPFYLSQHQNPICVWLHVIGSLSVLVTFISLLATQNFWWLFTLPVLGYLPAWIGHFFFEKNKPATFQYPLYSFLADWVMCYEVLFRKRNA